MNISRMIIHELFILEGRIMNYLIIHEFVNLDKAGRLLIFSSLQLLFGYWWDFSIVLNDLIH